MTDVVVTLTESEVEGLREYVQWYGAAHQNNCPQDDTCDCICKPLNDAVNAICQKTFDAEVVMAMQQTRPKSSWELKCEEARAQFDKHVEWADREFKALERMIEILEGQLKRSKEQRAEVQHALVESVKLQAHYAALLNMHDGGQRLIFPTVEAWLARLAGQ